MRGKKFTFEVAGRKVEVDADAEGECRYMVRMDAGKGRIRVGYLTGSGRTWLAEFFGSKPSVPEKSAKAACRVLAEWAIQQPGFRA